MNILYICYDGLTDMIGQSQVLPYLTGCAQAGHAITVISFEKPAQMTRLGAAVAERCEQAKIIWMPQKFRESPPYLAKALDQWTMHRAASRAIDRATRPFDLIHCRSYPAALTGARLKRRSGAKLLFDMRGFWADQRRDGGRWGESSLVGRTLYRRWKRHEAAIVANSDHIVVLANAARPIVQSWRSYSGAPVSVIPCCADFSLFQPAPPAARSAARRELGLPEDAPVLGYLGSLGTVYLAGQHLRLFDAIRGIDPRARMLFIGRVTADEVVAEAARQPIAIDAEDFRIVASDRAQVPHWLGAVDVATSLIMPSWSSLGVSPTKVGEYLASGVPVIANRGIGDVGEIIAETQGGHLMNEFSDEDIEAAAKAFFGLLGRDRNRLSVTARKLLDLPLAIAAYDHIYRDPETAVDLGMPR